MTLSALGTIERSIMRCLRAKLARMSLLKLTPPLLREKAAYMVGRFELKIVSSGLLDHMCRAGWLRGIGF